MDKINGLLQILKEEVAPALGCTGPTSVSLAVAKAHDLVKGEVNQVKVLMDRDTYKNSISVGIPGTQYRGLEMAASLGAVAGDSDKGLEVLNGVQEKDEKKALEKIKNNDIIIEIDWDRKGMGLYIEARVTTENGYGKAIIHGTHTNFVYLEANDKVIYQAEESISDQAYKLDAPIAEYTIDDFIDFADGVDASELSIIKETLDMNLQLAEAGLEGAMGSGFGKGWSTFDQSNVIYKARAYVAAASDARMAGLDLPAMACASSGNVGITASIPVKVFADYLNSTQEELLKAVALSYLVTIYAKMHIGRLSPVCACAIAASLGVGAGCGYLKNLNHKQIGHVLSNIIGAIGGVLCDGAKEGCALKLSVSIGIAMENVFLVEQNAFIFDNQGLVGKNADESLELLGKIARIGMVQADHVMSKEIIKRNASNKDN